MKVGVPILVVVVLAGCSSEGMPRIPTAPAAPLASTPTTGSALLWVMVIDKTGACIDGGTIQIVGTQGAGEPTQPGADHDHPVGRSRHGSHVNS